MRKTEEDRELRSFFQSIKQKDERIAVPEFPEIKKTRSINWWIPAGIAASLTVGFILTQEKEPTAAPPIREVVIFTLEEGPDQELQFNIEHTNEMDIWESPTATLLTEY
jgi:hypothetical protein